MQLGEAILSNFIPVIISSHTVFLLVNLLLLSVGKVCLYETCYHHWSIRPIGKYFVVFAWTFTPFFSIGIQAAFDKS